MTRHDRVEKLLRVLAVNNGTQADALCHLRTDAAKADEAYEVGELVSRRLKAVIVDEVLGAEGRLLANQLAADTDGRNTHLLIGQGDELSSSGERVVGEDAREGAIYDTTQDVRGHGFLE